MQSQRRRDAFCSFPLSSVLLAVVGQHGSELGCSSLHQLQLFLLKRRRRALLSASDGADGGGGGSNGGSRRGNSSGGGESPAFLWREVRQRLCGPRSCPAAMQAIFSPPNLRRGLLFLLWHKLLEGERKSARETGETSCSDLLWLPMNFTVFFYFSCCFPCHRPLPLPSSRAGLTRAAGCMLNCCCNRCPIEVSK